MPKRVGFLYDKFSDREFVRGVFIEACRHRGRKRKDVAWVREHLDQCVENVCRLLETDSFKPTPVRCHRIYDTSSQKWRDIKTVPFYPDCLVQWLIVEVLKDPVFYRGMDANSSASIPNRGCIHVYRKIRAQIRKRHKHATYAFQCDIKQYYPSIDLDLLVAKLRRRCKDERLLSLIRDIVRSASEGSDRGLAIGAYLNQWLANFFLEDADRTVRKTAKSTDLYVRYMDNTTVLSGNKRRLKAVRGNIEDALAKDGLRLKEDWQIYPVASRPVKAVGYKFYSNGCIMLRKRNWLKFRRQLLRVTAKQQYTAEVSPKQASGLLSRIGAAEKHLASARSIWLKYLNNLNIKPLLRVVRERSIA